ncbi:class I SAM-dependent methyltransferase [Micromonosporaceae bacterium DT55]|uniref:class I SAM-dependent methyltransferase n=1 Tax=Melissospora conviva TaxID=3388432 RepID=UPI003C243943
MVEHTQALSFGPAAGDYDRFRPPYPLEAVAFAIGFTAPARVVDLGAGTGILSRGVAALGHEVVAVEPDPEMRARLVAGTPGVTALAGSAEAVPLPDGAADAVVAGQAYHWFDPDRAHPEIARLLRPGGSFAPIWNLRDESAPWVDALSQIIEGIAGSRGDRAGRPEPEPDFGELFGPAQRAEFAHRVTHDVTSLIGLLRTRSYYLTADVREQRRLEQQVRALTEEHPDLAGRESFELPYRTVVHRARRR